ncbi:MAG TPA: nucleotidyltransferase family protein [Oligoflexus sp.]|jgi:predicted nucleotidyltransferase|uniref:nucleotidyltransferase family protein n=1 Tax=Oligoflexus sp. TaxID=1971216 RepID=UPI002D80C357|nr:nucleotidyltransferase family protein [Oligoflexus sp.]HET9237453.1 nucleotidyltransferase family protein [Oligoflexus sp.]
MTPLEKIKAHRQEILDIAKKYGASNIRIFGSVARGEARPDSDYDFLIELEPGRSAFEIGGLLMDLQDLLGAKVDIVTDKGLNKHIREKVLKEAIAV